MVFKIFIINLFLICLCYTKSYGGNYLQEAVNYTVKIKAQSQYPFAETKDAGIWFGAGFLINKKKGYILTNAHVSGRGDTELKIKFKNGSYQKAKPIYIDPEYDLAIIKINTKKIPNFSNTAELDCNFKSKPGVIVAAFGHPKGLSFSASRGIVSQERILNERRVIQTDAAINSGNSGGPLINLSNGRVIGVNKSKYKKNSEGLGFAVPIDIACKILYLLEEKKDPSPPLLNIRFAKDNDEESQNIIAYLKLKNKYIEMGSKLIEANGKTVYNSSDLNLILRGSISPAVLKFKNKNGIQSYTIPFTKAKRVLDREYIFLDGAIISEQIQKDKNFFNRKFYIHSVLNGSGADNQNLWARCWIRFINGKEPENLIKLYIMLKAKKSSNIIYSCWSNKDNLLTENYHTKFRTNNDSIYLKSINFIKPDMEIIHSARY